MTASGCVTLNVGGTKYQTYQATLSKAPEGSFLGSLVLSQGTEMFIDRDGPSFRYVLNWLRGPAGAPPVLPRDSCEREQLAREADYYGLEELCTLCKGALTQDDLLGTTTAKQYPCKDLRGCSLRYMNLRGWNLGGCNLSGVDATNCDFSGADLRGCDFSGIKLSNTIRNGETKFDEGTIYGKPAREFHKKRESGTGAEMFGKDAGADY